MASQQQMLNWCLILVVAAIVVWILISATKTKEGYADQVIHGGVGAIAGPAISYDYYPYDQEMYDDSPYRY